MGNQQFCCPAHSPRLNENSPGTLQRIKPDKPANQMKRLTVESFKNPHASNATGRNTVYYSCVGSQKTEQDLLFQSGPEESIIKPHNGDLPENADTGLEENEVTKDRSENRAPSERTGMTTSRLLSQKPVIEYNPVNKEVPDDSPEESFYEPDSCIKEKQEGDDPNLNAVDLKNVLPEEENKVQPEAVPQVQLTPQQAEWLRAVEEAIKQIQVLHEQDFEGYQKIFEEKKKKHGLTIYTSNYKNQEGYKINRSRSEWIVPCKAEQFLKFMAHYEEQRRLDSHIDTWTQLDVFGETEETCGYAYYLAYKKVLICDPRDFLYLKYYKKINENTWCDVSKGILHSDYPEFKNKVRGEILMVGYVVTEHVDPSTGKYYSKVKLYSENNFKMNIPDFIAKTFASTEMKGFVEACIKRLGELYPQEEL